MDLVGLAGAGVVGFLVGYAVKKTLKVVAVVVGLFLLSLVILQYYNVIQVNWAAVEQLLTTIVSKLQAFLNSLMTNNPDLNTGGEIVSGAIAFALGALVGSKT